MTVGIAIVSLWENPHVPPSLAVSDKLMHGVMYAFLAIGWMVPIVRARYSNCGIDLFKRCVLVCVCVTSYGALIEILQRFCTLTRSGEMADLYADFAGALIGVVLVALFVLLKNRR